MTAAQPRYPLVLRMLENLLQHASSEAEQLELIELADWVLDAGDDG